MEIGVKVYSRGRKWIGRTTGSQRHCRLDGCGGLRIGVRWKRKTASGRDRITWPCMQGMGCKTDPKTGKEYWIIL